MQGTIVDLLQDGARKTWLLHPDGAKDDDQDVIVIEDANLALAVGMVITYTVEENTGSGGDDAVATIYSMA